MSENKYQFKGTVKDMPGYEGLYLVSDLGIIYSIGSNWRGYGTRELSQGVNSYGYPSVHLTKNGVSRRVVVHKLVALTFLGERNGLQVRHLDGNKRNNALSNLKYGTAKENADDREAHNKTARGSRIASSKLSDSEVADVSVVVLF